MSYNNASDSNTFTRLDRHTGKNRVISQERNSLRPGPVLFNESLTRKDDERSVIVWHIRTQYAVCW
jgi:hypothetical protein